MANRRIENPILNSPFDPPSRHFAFDADGITDEVVEGRRRSTHLTPIPPVKRARKAQAEIEYVGEGTERVVENAFINQVRDRVDRWRQMGYPNVTVTSRRLLEHWTAEGREKRFFFCQVEALETVIYLAEAAHKDTGGSFLQEELRRYATEHNPGLYRIALKMATGTGKTVVMAMLIAWQTLNKAANPQDGRFTDAFLLVCPGITIRDRLRVLIPSEADNYYDERDVVPPELRSRLGRATVVITNFHSFLAREKVKAAATTKRLLTRGRVDRAGVFTETPDQVVLRVCREFRAKRSIVVINDEAHHCYRPKAVPAETPLETLTRDQKDEAKAREREARVWADGLTAVHAKLGVKTVYDLSATPFFLAGSGWPEGTLFPWVVSDFGLVDAIEAGLVKVPRVPVDDDAAPVRSGDATPAYRNLWERIRPELPASKAAKDLAEPVEPQLPPALEGALLSLYRDYEAKYRAWEKARTTPTPPVFIVVCNTTTTSKLVFDWVAGWAKPVVTPVPTGEAGPEGEPATDPAGTLPIAGHLPLFSNVVNDRFVDRPVTILVDSAQLDSGASLSPEFKAAAATEIAELKADIARRKGAGAADDLDDATIMREVMNTVGKPGQLGEGVRCVVSVSMLTEGWDANTVTHILGVRAFGTQLLAEQVVGRGLRRRSYAVEDTPEGERFALEYAEIYGIPFSFIPAGGAGAEPKATTPTTRVWAPPDRHHLTIRFPHVVGYRREENVDQILTADFAEASVLELSSAAVPTTTEVAGIVGEREIHTLDALADLREQEVAFHLAHRLVRTYLVGADGQVQHWRFGEALHLVRQWLHHPNGLRLKDNAFVGLLALTQRQAEVVDRIWAGVARHERALERLRPVLRDWEPIGSTEGVDFETTKDPMPTQEDLSPVTHVVADSGWEHDVARRLEEMAEPAAPGQPRLHAYVKNQGLGFGVPYRDGGQTRTYVPDFIATFHDGPGDHSSGPVDLVHVLIEVSGQRDDNKKARVSGALDLWVPAVNAHGGLGRWVFAEVTDPFDVHSTIRAALATAPTRST